MIATKTLQDIYNYSESYSTTHSQLLQDVYRESYLKTLKPRMTSGPLQGRVLSFISKLIQPQYIVEIGTFTGYATLCMAEGLTAGGKIITIEVNEELQYISQKYFDLSPWKDQIHQQVGDALTLLPTLDDGIDLVFIDAKKRDYIKYYNLIIEKVSQGGVVLADNILWDGKVTNATKDKTTQLIHDFNIMIQNDDRVENVILPLRDGVNMIIKK